MERDSSKAIKTNYQKTKYFKSYFEYLEKIYQKEWEILLDLNYELLMFIMEVLKIETKVIVSSELNIKSTSTQRLVDICKELKADTYLSGDYAGDAYLDKEPFEKGGINLTLQNSTCPKYSQLFHEKGFIFDLSIIDLIFNEKENTIKILKGL